MIIYDFSHQQILNYNELGIALIFLLLGLLLFFIFSKYVPKFTEDFSTRFMGLTKRNLEESSKLVPPMFKAMGVILILGAFTMLYNQSRGFFYVNFVHQFEDIITTDCKIDSILTTPALGTNFITIFADNKTFNIKRDDKYISHRNLLPNDSITIEYFKNADNSNRFETEVNEVIMIKLKQKSSNYPDPPRLKSRGDS